MLPLFKIQSEGVIVDDVICKGEELNIFTTVVVWQEPLYNVTE
jgi:hypothetical protein